MWTYFCLGAFQVRLKLCLGRYQDEIIQIILPENVLRRSWPSIRQCLDDVCKSSVKLPGRNNFVTRNVPGIPIPYQDGPRWNVTWERLGTFLSPTCDQPIKEEGSAVNRWTCVSIISQKPHETERSFITVHSNFRLRWDCLIGGMSFCRNALVWKVIKSEARTKTSELELHS